MQVVFFLLLLNLLSTHQSDIAAAETHDNHFDGQVLKRPGPECGARSILCPLIGAICLTNACQTLPLECAPRTHLISLKTT